MIRCGCASEQTLSDIQMRLLHSKTSMYNLLQCPHNTKLSKCVLQDAFLNGDSNESEELDGSIDE